MVRSDGDDVTHAVVPNRLCFFFSSLPPFIDVVGALSSLVVRVSSSKGSCRTHTHTIIILALAGARKKRRKKERYRFVIAFSLSLIFGW